MPTLNPEAQSCDKCVWAHKGFDASQMHTYVFCGSSNHMQSVIGRFDVHALEGVTTYQLIIPVFTGSCSDTQLFKAVALEHWVLFQASKTPGNSIQRASRGRTELLNSGRRDQMGHLFDIIMWILGTEASAMTLGRRSFLRPAQGAKHFK